MKKQKWLFAMVAVICLGMSTTIQACEENKGIEVGAAPLKALSKMPTPAALEQWLRKGVPVASHGGLCQAHWVGDILYIRGKQPLDKISALASSPEFKGEPGMAPSQLVHLATFTPKGGCKGGSNARWWSYEEAQNITECKEGEFFKTPTSHLLLRKAPPGVDFVEEGKVIRSEKFSHLTTFSKAAVVGDKLVVSSNTLKADRKRYHNEEMFFFDKALVSPPHHVPFYDAPKYWHRVSQDDFYLSNDGKWLHTHDISTTEIIRISMDEGKLTRVPLHQDLKMYRDTSSHELFSNTMKASLGNHLWLLNEGQPTVFRVFDMDSGRLLPMPLQYDCQAKGPVAGFFLTTYEDSCILGLVSGGVHLFRVVFDSLSKIDETIAADLGRKIGKNSGDLEVLMGNGTYQSLSKELKTRARFAFFQGLEGDD